mgnify:CR=1 FL=1
MDGFPFRSFSFFSIISTSVEVRLPSFKRMNDHLSTTSPNDEEKRFEETIDKKKEEELTAEEKNQREELSKKVVTLRDERNERLRQIGEKDSLVRQIIDLALLTSGMLKGKNLTEFIQRSISLIEK